MVGGIHRHARTHQQRHHLQVRRLHGLAEADVDAWIAVNPDSELIPVARANGITHALTLPAGGTIAGRSGVIALDGWTWEEMEIARSAAVLEPPVAFAISATSSCTE